jgi:AraC-like DNA-binding protein
LPVDLAALGDSWVTVAQFDRLVDGFAEASGDPAFALHLGEMFNLFDLAILTTLINTSRNLGEAAANFARFRALFNPLFHMTIVRDRETAEIAYQPTPGEPLSAKPRYAEFVLAFHLCYARWLLRQPIAVRAAAFRHPRPAYAAEYERIFACPVAFDAGADRFVVDAAVLDLPLGSAFAEYNRQAEALAVAQLGRVPQDSTLPEVIRLIRAHLADPAFDLERTARALGTGARTLQRRLQDGGVSFSSLRDQVRSELALELMRRVDLTIDEVAAELGYAERSNFTHAFSRWTGMTPGAFRRRMVPGS